MPGAGGGGAVAVVSLPAPRCALSLPKLVFFARPRGAGGVGSEATSCVRFCCVSPLRSRTRAPLSIPRGARGRRFFFLSFCCVWVRKGGRGAGAAGQCWRPLVVWVPVPAQPVPPLLVPSGAAATGAASSLAPRSGFARARASARGSFAARRGADAAVVQSGM